MAPSPPTYDFRFIIPTRDSARWIGAFNDAYRRIGIEPLYLCDTRSTDDTIGILRQRGAHVAENTPRGDFAEAGFLDAVRRHAGTKWVFRLDDDEFPSRALVSWIINEGVALREPTIFISRRELFRHGQRIVYSRAAGRIARQDRPNYLHPQPRLFQPARLVALNRVHSPGFLETPYFAYAPEDAFFAHCSCLMRSGAERLGKIRHYESILPGSSWALADEYLPELFDLEWHNAGDDGLSEFNELVSALPVPDDRDAPVLTPEERELMMSQVARFAAECRQAKDAYAAIWSARHRTGSDLGNDLQTGDADYPLRKITFANHTMPRDVELITGVSHPEVWGRWSEGPQVRIVFGEPLPVNFVLEFQASPFETMRNRAISVHVGEFNAALRMRNIGPARYRLVVSNAGNVREIVLEIPHPASPQSLGESTDIRQLGVAFRWLSIKPLQTALAIVMARALNMMPRL